MKHFLVVASAIAALVTGCGQAAPGSSTHALVGTMTVNNSMGSLQIIGGPCTGKQGFEDIHGGTAVVVKDQSSTILATGSLSDGTAPDRFSCHFTFRVASVPDASFYQVEVSSRGQVTYSRADLDAAGWKVSLTLGS